MAAGTSFAYLRVTRTQTDENVVSSLDCIEVQLFDGVNAFNIQNAYPIKDEDGLNQIPYSFSLKNNCEQGVTVDIGFELLSNTTLSANNLKINFARKNGLAGTKILSSLMNGTPLNNGVAYILKTDYLNYNETKSYDFRMWLPYELTEDDIHGQVLDGKIIITSTASDNDLVGAPKGWDESTKGTLLYAIKSNYLEPEGPMTVPGREFVYGKVSSVYVSSTYKNYYFTYGDGYFINSSNKFELTNPRTAKYSTNYRDLVGKYISVTSTYSLSKSSDTLATYNSAYVYLILDATYNSSNGTGEIYYKLLKTIDSVSSYQQNYYCTYGDGFEYGYNIHNANISKYSEIYEELPGKIVGSSSFSSFCLSSNRMTNTSNLSAIYNISVATPNYIVVDSLREKSLSATEDDYGTSYYFRGAVEDNYVSFAGMCWRIARILGDGSIKLVLNNYNPTNASNPCAASLDNYNMAFARYSSSDTSVYTSRFNKDNVYSNAGIGYMYSNLPYNDFETAQANNKDSTILTNLKSWYDMVFSLADKEKLADVIWCNDKRPETDASRYTSLESGDRFGTAIGTDKTLYKPNTRLYPFSEAVPSLKCGESKTDNLISKFTGSTTTDGGYGNGKLNGYKIGLLTADEIAFAGSAQKAAYEPVDFYLTSNAAEKYFTLSPNGLPWDNVFIYIVSNYGAITTANLGGNLAVRPSVALKSNTNISGGAGTQDDPFIVN